MSKLFSLNNLCANQDELLGVSADRESSCVICTISKKLVFVLELSQTQKKSWSTSETFSSKVIYDQNRQQYVGVFSNIYIRFWDYDTDDINKVKRIKFNRRIKELIHSHNNKTVVIYEDGNCESLDLALESRKNRRETSSNVDFTLEDPRISSTGIFSFVKKKKSQKTFLYTFIDDDTIQSAGPFYSIALQREGSENIRLIGTTVITCNNQSSLISIWNDRRIFSCPLNGGNEVQTTIGSFHATIDVISTKHELSITPISDKCVIIYACNEEEDSSSLLIYNLKYKVIQSRMDFKVFIPFVKLWHAQNNVFFGLGQYIKSVPFLLNEDKLSSMIGAQRNIADRAVDSEMINEDFIYEEALEFDETQGGPVDGMEFIPNNRHWKQQKKNLSGAQSISGKVEVRNQLNELYRGEVMIEVVKPDDQPMISSKLFSNVDEGSIMATSEGVEYYCNHLERNGYGEIEITNKIIPVLIKANRTQDIGLVLKRYNNISEQMLVMILKYVLECPIENEANDVDDTTTAKVKELRKEEMLSGKKMGNSNIFLTTKQSERRDVLSIALCCAFDSTSILPFISNFISLSEMIQLMDYLYETLTTTNVLYDPFDIRGSLIEADDFDIDSKLFEWFRLLLDSHYQQILLSRDTHLGEKLNQWLELIDSHIGILNEMRSMRPLLLKLARNKTVELSKKCNKWYTIEKLSLY